MQDLNYFLRSLEDNAKPTAPTKGPPAQIQTSTTSHKQTTSFPSTPTGNPPSNPSQGKASQRSSKSRVSDQNKAPKQRATHQPPPASQLLSQTSPAFSTILKSIRNNSNLSHYYQLSESGIGNK